MINSADIGDFLYIIILGILMIVGIFEKIAKAKRQPPPPSPHPYDDFENVDEQQPQPQTLEDLMRRMMQTQTAEAPKNETVGKANVKNYYQPIKMENLEKQFPDVQFTEEVESGGLGFEFDIRQAIISSEILNRKY